MTYKNLTNMPLFTKGFTCISILCILFLAPSHTFAQTGKTKMEPVKLVHDEQKQRVDITIGGKPFTSYIYPATIKKPVLYPVLTSGGTAITRGFPLEPRAGERIDHPHHVGLWFNYGDVNGLDFWNNSDSIAPEKRGRIVLFRAG